MAGGSVCCHERSFVATPQRVLFGPPRAHYEWSPVLLAWVDGFLGAEGLPGEVVGESRLDGKRIG